MAGKIKNNGPSNSTLHIPFSRFCFFKLNTATEEKQKKNQTKNIVLLREFLGISYKNKTSFCFF